MVHRACNGAESAAGVCGLSSDSIGDSYYRQYNDRILNASSEILEILIVLQIMKIFPSFYGIQIFNASCTRARDLSLCQSDRSNPHPPSGSEIHLNTILQYTLGTSRWSPRRFSHHNPVCTSLFPRHTT